MDFSKHVRHYTEIQDADDSHYDGSDELHSISSRFGRLFEFQKLGINHDLLKPEGASSYPHAEEDEEEFIYVIEGTPDVWINGHLKRLKPGDGVGFPSGTGICHTFINNSDSDVRLLVVGEKSKPKSKIYYPNNPERQAQVKDNWWSDVPKHPMGTHNGKPGR